MVELLRTVIVNVLESLESGDGYRTLAHTLSEGCVSEGCGLRGTRPNGKPEWELGNGNLAPTNPNHISFM